MCLYWSSLVSKSLRRTQADWVAGRRATYGICNKPVYTVNVKKYIGCATVHTVSLRTAFSLNGYCMEALEGLRQNAC